MELDKIASAINKTGFKLEYDIGAIIRNYGWHLISNRCYIDDQAGTVREIDLLAYRVSKVEDFSVYTVLIISCKKSEENYWSLLSRATEEKDPNYNWMPFKGWSNHPPLNYYLQKMTWAASYHDKFSQKCPQIFSRPEVDVFAFQEIKKSNYTVQNDKNIFSSITSLMKAQAYEMSLLEERNKTNKRIYQFNLISVIDSKIVRVHFDKNTTTTTEVDSEDYLCRYILNKKEEIARIKFVTAKCFESSLEHYTKLHTENVETFKEHYKKFFQDAYREWSKAKLILPEFNKVIKPAIRYALYRITGHFKDIADVSITWDQDRDLLQIDIDHDDINIGIIKEINKDDHLKSLAEKALKDAFKFNGKFEFDIGIPF